MSAVAAPAKRKRLPEGVIDECISGLIKKYGYVTSSLLVAEARDPNHPLHHKFEWNDSVAAEKYRIEQAAQIIRACKFVASVQDNHEPVEVRRFLCTGTEEGKYLYRPQVFREAASRKYFIDEKIHILNSWVNETHEVEELSDLRGVILRGLEDFKKA